MNPHKIFIPVYISNAVSVFTLIYLSHLQPIQNAAFNKPVVTPVPATPYWLPVTFRAESKTLLFVYMALYTLAA